MERLNAMKKRNRWRILVAGLILCISAGFLNTTELLAAEQQENDPMSMGYLDPFNLTVEALVSMDTSATTEPALTGGHSEYVPPLKIWIPYRPTFRSPCAP